MEACNLSLLFFNWKTRLSNPVWTKRCSQNHERRNTHSFNRVLKFKGLQIVLIKAHFRKSLSQFAFYHGKIAFTLILCNKVFINIDAVKLHMKFFDSLILWNKVFLIIYTAKCHIKIFDSGRIKQMQ